MALTLANVIPLRLATVSYPDGHPRTGTGPVYAFAIRTGERVLLVDTGVGPPHPLIDRLYAPERRTLEAAFADAGLHVRNIAAVVNTHLHFDHCGQNALFPDRPVFVQAAEYEAAQASLYTVREFVEYPGANYQLLEGDAPIAPGVSVVATPGHTAGHQSVVVDVAGDGPIVIAGQATETAAEYDHFARLADRQAAKEDDSLMRLRALRPQRVYFSHDDASWPLPEQPPAA